MDTTLAAYLRRCRTRIPPQVTRLGSYDRLPSRIGKSVTQEEVAEAIDVTRTWYGRLETDAGVYPSLTLLNRIASALMLKPIERFRLLILAAKKPGQ
ncbi:MAG TPA: helix-turn-helix transcriptional regulator [Candidatus Baltobacteraceae bacterium]|jgi:DNA-binding XRE family transcriptional regulator|nr:helix-turn-helix transcriptional regulator [Candidatus Baltobacteraceae bacterium]